MGIEDQSILNIAELYGEQLIYEFINTPGSFF